MTRPGRAEEAREGKSEGPLLEIFNTVDYTKAQYRSAMEGLIEGAILAVSSSSCSSATSARR
jgi:hypothetical protein